MRQKFTPKMSLFNPVGRNSFVKELAQISEVLDANPRLMELVFEDLTTTSRSNTCRKGMAAEQVLRCAVYSSGTPNSRMRSLPFIWRTLMPSAPSPGWRWVSIPQSLSSRKTSWPSEKNMGSNSS